MKFQMICATIMVIVCAVCGTVLLMKWLDGKIKKWMVNRAVEAQEMEQKRAKRAAAPESEWIRAYYEKDDECEELKTKLVIVEDQLRRAREQMAKVMIADFGK